MVKGRTTRNSLSASWDDAGSTMFVNGEPSFATLTAAVKEEPVSPKLGENRQNRPQNTSSPRKTKNDQLLVIEISDFPPDKDDIDTSPITNGGDSEIDGQSPVKKITFCDLEILLPATFFESSELLQDAIAVPNEDAASSLSNGSAGNEPSYIKPPRKRNVREFFVCAKCDSTVPSEHQFARHLRLHRNQPQEKSNRDYSHLIRPCHVQLEPISEALIQELTAKKEPEDSRSNCGRGAVSDPCRASSLPGSTKSVQPKAGTSYNSCNGTSHVSCEDEVYIKSEDTEFESSEYSSDIETPSFFKNSPRGPLSPADQRISKPSISGGGFMQCSLCTFGASHINILRDHVLGSHFI
ncbi:Hypothetical protein NTJ_02332 [Nesidiocoris tenuis]|uniref:C2H2-type domain-containing protein n=1 Tax=Nesidiocoris tenuis TaxID=355587 RepID=A0ABN7AB78_9HEMI|nr:Hypothetical protein NTJ_02332 [Nesidiocoris tenuis]